MRHLLFFFGWLLLILGWLTVGAATGAILLCSFLSASEFTPTSPLWSLSFIFGGAIGLLGYSLVEGRKKTLLFLRPFGVTSANAFTVTLIGAYLRRSLRIVALNDGNLPTPGVHRTSRLLFLVVAIPVMLIMTLLLAIFQPLPGQGHSAIPKVNLLLFYCAWGMFTAPIFRTFNARALRNQFSISSTADLGRAAKRVARVGGFSLNVTTPQVTAFTCSDSLWQQTVAQLVDHADAVVIDLSLATHNLCWELELLKSRPLCRYALISKAPGPGTIEKHPGDGSAARLRELLGDSPVLTYKGVMEPARPFAKALMRRLARCSL
jgi:hypothetical protein